jgi:hypothetical protein
VGWSRVAKGLKRCIATGGILLGSASVWKGGNGRDVASGSGAASLLFNAREARLVSLGEMNDRASNRSKSIIVW